MSDQKTPRERLIDAVWLVRQARLEAVVLTAERTCIRVEAPGSVAEDWLARLRPHAAVVRLVLSRSETGSSDDETFGDRLGDIVQNLADDGEPRFVAVAAHDRALFEIDCRLRREDSSLRKEAEL